MFVGMFLRLLLLAKLLLPVSEQTMLRVVLVGVGMFSNFSCFFFVASDAAGLSNNAVTNDDTA